ncbi:glycosyltransferase family 4 protein [Candidatus Uabimicrobium amorphum]|uniref:Glycoside hydrolase n=1 Tax=Uabimicrobium amorphum TaxID=2596890 RepID=A0A5S9ILS9_UABAM|nr:glycosyltransferase family 4 protein [Candidatus Uabimicrobium amorphum]BBM83877.1 glycoside hydrolase [Candidatus Uabimicrobium amorphum]
MRKPQIVVSTPFRLHSHQQVYALQQQRYLQKYICSTWHKPQSFPYKYFRYLPKALQRKINAFCAKRSYEPIDAYYVEQHPFAEVVRVLLNELTRSRFNKYLVDWQHQTHDSIAAKRLKKLHPDIVVGYEISCAETFRTAKEMGITTVLDLANVHYEYCTPLEKIFDGDDFDHQLTKAINQRKEIEYRHSDYILCISQLAYNSLRDNGIPEEKIRLVNLGADLSIFQCKKHQQNEKFSMLFVGSVIKRKGVDLLLEALQELQLKNSELTIVGANDHNDILSKYDQSLFTHIPFLPHSELVQHFHKAHVFILPSYLDSWGMVVNEAMACGTPVIISDNVGSKDLVTKENGFVVPHGNVKALQEKILYCYHHRDELFAMGQKAGESVVKFTWEQYARNLCVVIDDIYKNRK